MYVLSYFIASKQSPWHFCFSAIELIIKSKLFVSLVTKRNIIQWKNKQTVFLVALEWWVSFYNSSCNSWKEVFARALQQTINRSLMIAALSIHLDSVITLTFFPVNHFLFLFFIPITEASREELHSSGFEKDIHKIGKRFSFSLFLSFSLRTFSDYFLPPWHFKTDLISVKKKT